MDNEASSLKAILPRRACLSDSRFSVLSRMSRSFRSTRKRHELAFASRPPRDCLLPRGILTVRRSPTNKANLIDSRYCTIASYHREAASREHRGTASD